MKKILLIFIILIFSFHASAQSIGSFSYESTKKATVEAEYTLGIFNLKNETLQVGLEANNFDGSVEFQDKEFSLEPSTTSSNPTGSDWISLSGNNYVKPRNVKFTVMAENSQNFTVNAQVSRVNEDEGSGPQVVQVLSNSFSYVRTSDDPIYRNDRSVNEAGEELKLSKMNKTESEDTEESSVEENISDKLIKGSLSNESEKSQNDGIDPLTGVLALGAAGSLYYLWSVV